MHLRMPDLDQLPDPPGPVFLGPISPKGKNPLVEFDMEKQQNMEEVRRGRFRQPRIRFGGLPLGLFKSSPHSTKSNEQWKQEEAAHAATARSSREQRAMDRRTLEKKPDRWKPLPPVPMKRSSGLPLNMFGSQRSQSNSGGQIMSKDMRSHGGRRPDKPVPQPKKKKRGSGLPIDMFGSNLDSLSSSDEDDTPSNLGSSL
jgi:hypothetical protein